MCVFIKYECRQKGIGVDSLVKSSHKSSSSAADDDVGIKIIEGVNKSGSNLYDKLMDKYVQEQLSKDNMLPVADPNSSSAGGDIVLVSTVLYIINNRQASSL